MYFHFLASHNVRPYTLSCLAYTYIQHSVQVFVSVDETDGTNSD